MLIENKHSRNLIVNLYPSMMVAKNHEIIAYIVSKQRIKYFVYKFIITCIQL
jgi:hypothetical protein